MSQGLCVLGMMRTGTSAVAGTLELLGVHFGPEERLLEPNIANPTGFREHKGIVALNDELLARLGGTWYEPPATDLGWHESADLDDLRAVAKELVDRDLATADTWAWKDPRTCLTLPFWQTIVPSFAPVICLRGPADTARSVAAMEWAARRLERPFETGLDLWLRYTTGALEDTHVGARLLVFYDELLADSREQCGRLAAFAGLSERLTPPARQAIDAFLSPSLRHHTTESGLAERFAEHPAYALYARLKNGD